MGTTLTGTTPQDTYDSLIKVTDNGPLSATGKLLTDGLGNDSVLALSTAAVGIGTNAPDSLLHVNNLVNTAYDPSNALASGQTMRLSNLSTTSGISSNLLFVATGAGGGNGIGTISGVNTGTGSLAFTFATRDSGGSVTEKMRITSAGNVGIGTSAPANKLTVVGAGSFDGAMVVRSTGTNTPQAVLGVDAIASAAGYVGTINNIPFQIRTNDVTRLRIDADGLKFGSDTAAANALDDYEEGTWTMGMSFGGASVGVTAAENTGTYTKIGRQVTVNGYLELTSKGSSTGDARITGLPFTIPNVTANYNAASFRLNLVTFANQFQGNGQVNSTTISFNEITEAGVVSSLTNADFADNSGIMVNFTYFV